MAHPTRLSLRSNPSKGMGWVWAGLAAGLLLAGGYVVAARRRYT